MIKKRVFSLLSIRVGIPHTHAHSCTESWTVQFFYILVASVLVQWGIATNAVDRPLRYNTRRSWLPTNFCCTKNVFFFLIVRLP